MRKPILCGSLAALTLTLFAPLAGATEPCSEGLRQSVLAYVRAEARQAGTQFLRTIRREDLEEDFFGHQRKIPGRIKKTVCVFEVTDTGWEIVSPSEARLHTSTAPGRWIVVAGNDGGPLYGLRGFSKAEADFNALAGFLGIEIRSQADAVRWAELYNLLVLSEEYGSIITSPRDLRDQAEDIEEAYRLSRSVAFSASNWLEHVSRQPIQYGIRAEPSQGGYAISLVSVSISADRLRVPVLRRIRLTLKQGGAFVDKIVEVLQRKKGSA